MTCSIQREIDVYLAISRGREMATVQGFDLVNRTRIEIVILELTRNLLAHAGGGTLTLTPVNNDQQQPAGMCVEANDNGPGIADVTLALQDGYSTTHTLGAGLPGVKRLMDDFSIETTVGVGTRVRATKWLPIR